MPAEEHADIAERIESIIDNIEIVRNEMGHPAADPRTGLAVPKVPVVAAQRLKSSVDQFRLFLWAYLDSWALGSSTPDSRLQQIRMAAAADMLSMLNREFSADGVPISPEARRLGEQLHMLATVMIDFRNRDSA